MTIAVAGAPVSFGVFELTPVDAEVLAPDAILETLQQTGYVGVDLGPVGYLGRGSELSERLERFELELAGGWVELPFSDDEAFASSLVDLDLALRVFAEAAQSAPTLLPKPTLADSGSVARKARPGQGAWVDPLDDSCWNRIVANIETAAARVRAAGFEPTFHHHAGTSIESPDDIDRLLARVDIGLTLDTGHLEIGGGDALSLIERWAQRINHLHVKDIDRGLLHDVLARGGGMSELWSSGAFVALGTGDIDIAAVMTALTEADFSGWLVVEQDILNAPDLPLESFHRSRTVDHEVNRAALRRWC